MTPSKKLAAAAPTYAASGAPAGTYRYKGHLQAENRRRQAMADDRAASPRYVRDVILPELARQSGQAGPWSLEDRVIRGRDSWIFKAHAPDAPFPLALKVFCDAVEKKEIVRQAKLLSRHHDAMANRPDLSVPAPWAALPDHRTLVMEWIEEPSLDALLRRAGRCREERIRLLAAAGRWLSHFHDQSGLASGPLRTDRLQRRIDLLLGGETGAGHMVSDQTFRGAYAVLLRCADEFAGAPFPHATAHGDFMARNLLHGRRTIGIDIGGRPNFPVTHDMFRFLVQAEVERPLLTSASAGIRGSDAQAFLAAYGAGAQLGNDRLMAFLYLAATLTRWAHRINLFRQRRYRIFRVAEALRLRQLAKRALMSLEA